MTEPVIVFIDELDKLKERVLELYREKQKRLIISLAGIPGSGKTTLASKIAALLNSHVPSMVLPQDGYHFYRKELMEFENPEEAVFRRGAPFTFNVKAFVKLVKCLKEADANSETLTAPSFSHKLKDPVEDDIKIGPSIAIIIIEGNYVLLKDENWNEISSCSDDTWFIDTPFSLSRSRLIRRHIDAGICSTEKEAADRADGNDLVNGEYIVKHSITPNVIVKYRNFE